MFTPTQLLKMTIPAALLACVACSGSDSSDAGVNDTGATDTGSTDTGSTDNGVRDTGTPRDTGVNDTGPRDTGGDTLYCTMGGNATVDGVQVPLGEVSGTPLTPAGGAGSLNCIDRPQPDDAPFQDSFCIVECLDFFGSSPTAAEIADMEIAVFPQSINGVDVDPTFDSVTGLDREPQNRTTVGFNIAPEDGTRCSSMWQLELGWSTEGTTLNAETRYIIRVRTTTAAATPYPTTYHYNWIRRNDTTPDVTSCNNDQRIPDANLNFPVLTPAFVDSVIASAGAVPGSDDYGDGLGQGHVVIESRDCTGTGTLLAKTTVGLAPAPVGGYYVDATGNGFDTAGVETTDRAAYIAVGVGGNTATSSATDSVTFAVGATRTENTCTEEFGGLTIPVYADGVTYVRTGRETVVHDRN